MNEVKLSFRVDRTITVRTGFFFFHPMFFKCDRVLLDVVKTKRFGFVCCFYFVCVFVLLGSLNALSVNIVASRVCNI